MFPAGIFNLDFGLRCRRCGAALSLLSVQLKEIVQSAVCERTVYFRAVHRYIAIGKFHADMFTGIVVIVKLHINSGTGETPSELIP